MNKIHVLLASMIALVSIPAHAQIITWGTATNMTTDTDVANNGIAFDSATFFSTATTVNSVTFNALTTSGGGEYTDASGDISVLVQGGVLPPGMTYKAYAGGSTNYNNIASTLAYGFNGAGANSVTLSNLTAGDTYQVEVWSFDGNPADNGKVSTQLSGFGNGLLNPSTSATPPAVGQFVLGDFTATGSITTFTLTAPITSFAPNATFSIVNDISIRDITSTPEPSTWALMLAGIAGLSFFHRRSQASKSQ